MTALDDFCARAAGFLRAEAPLTWDHSDDDMNIKARMIPDGVKPKNAAVLVGLHDQDGETQVLLTQRQARLPFRAGGLMPTKRPCKLRCVKRKKKLHCLPRRSNRLASWMVT
jgi:hypothetical protein